MTITLTTFINKKKLKCLRTELHRLFKKFTCQKMEQLQRTLNSKQDRKREKSKLLTWLHLVTALLYSASLSFMLAISTSTNTPTPSSVILLFKSKFSTVDTQLTNESKVMLMGHMTLISCTCIWV